MMGESARNRSPEDDIPIDTSPLMVTIAAQVDSLTDEQAQEVWLKCATYQANARARASREKAARALLVRLFGDDVVALPVDRYQEAADRRLYGHLYES